MNPEDEKDKTKKKKGDNGTKEGRWCFNHNRSLVIRAESFVLLHGFKTESLFATGARREFHYFLSLFLNTIVRIMESWGAVSLIHKKFLDIDLDPHQKYLKS